MVKSFFKRQIFVFGAILALGMVTPLLGWGTTYSWVNYDSDTGDWEEGQWFPENGNVPGPNDVARFPVSIEGEDQLALSDGLSVGSILFDANDSYGFSTPAVTATFTAGQTLGPAGGNGNVVTNNSSTQQTIIMPGGTVQGGVSGSNTQFQFTDAATWRADGNPTVDASIQISNAETLMVVTSSAGSLINFNGIISGDADVIIGNGTTYVQASYNAQNTYSGTTTVNKGALLISSAAAFANSNELSLQNGSTLDVSPINLAGGNTTVTLPALSLAGSTNTLALGISAPNSTIINLAQTPNLDLSTLNLRVVNSSASALYGATQEFTLFTNAGTPTNNFNQVTLVGLDAFTGSVDPASLGTPTLRYIVQKKSDGNVQAAANTSIVTGNTAFKMAQVLNSTINTQRQLMRSEGTSFGAPPSFKGNPLAVPNVDVSYLSLTDGALDRAVEENMKCWNPLGRKKISIWAQPFGMVLNQGMVDGVPGFSSRTGGILFGMDYKVNPALLVGGGVGYAYTKTAFEENLGKSRVKDRFATVFSSFFGEEWHLDLALLGGIQHHRGYRRVEGTTLSMENQHEGYQIMPHIGGGVTFGMNECYQLHAFANVDYVYSHENRYQEHGANILNYFIEARDSSMLRSEVGFHIAQICDLETAQWLRSIKLSVINKAPLKKGPIVSSYGDSAQSTNLNTTFISPGVKSTLQYADGFSVGFNYNAEISLTNKTTSQEIILEAGKKF